MNGRSATRILMVWIALGLALGGATSRHSTISGHRLRPIGRTTSEPGAFSIVTPVDTTRSMLRRRFPFRAALASR
jgi:hypothetical protein